MTTRHTETRQTDTPQTGSRSGPEDALAELYAGTSECSITIPDAALPLLLAATAAAIQCPDLPSRHYALMCEAWYRLARRLEEVRPASLEVLALTEPEHVDPDQARAILAEAWPDEGEQLVCWMTSDSALRRGVSV